MTDIAQNTTRRDADADQIEYGMGCLTQARSTLTTMLGLFELVASDEGSTEDDIRAFRREGAGLATNLTGAICTLEELDDDEPSGDSDATAPLYGIDDLGEVIPLRDAVNLAISNIEGIVRECRREMDKACAMHTYAVGRCGGDCSKGCAAEDDMDEKFNASMAEAAGALRCLLRYVDNIRSDAAAKTGRAPTDRESGISHAAEE